MMIPTKTSAVQWWIWRMSRPAWTSKLRRSTDANASDTGTPRRGS